MALNLSKTGREELDRLIAMYPTKQALCLPVLDLAQRELGAVTGEVITEISRGGMGIVYKARDTSLKKTVAIKVLIRGGNASEEERKRFRREAEARGVPCKVLMMPSLSFDVDRPEDLAALLHMPGKSRARDVLHAMVPDLPELP